MAFIIVISLYSLLVLVLAFGFARLEELPDVKARTILPISVIIPVRNETTIPNVDAILYPNFEVIVVDDHSDTPIQAPPNVRVIPSLSHGKKAAITTGVAHARGEIIVTTDADCTVSPLWLEKINAAFHDPKTKMVVGGVRIAEKESFFSKLQALEFVSVAATGAATLGLGLPTMCNGANLAYRKQSFLEAGGYQGNEGVSSGDDEFLMNKFSRDSIEYLYSRSAIVTSSPLHLVPSFIDQRLRWAGKWRVSSSLSTKTFAVVVWLFHVAFVAMPFLVSWKLFVTLACAKVFVEAILLMPAANFFGVKWRWTSFLVLQFIYSIYVIYVGFMSQILLPKWKGRAVETKV